MDIRPTSRIRLCIGHAALALATAVPAASAIAADWWIVSAKGLPGPRFSAFIDQDSIVSFDDPDGDGRRLFAVEMKIVREEGSDALEETHAYQIDCSSGKIRFAALHKHPRLAGAYQGGVFARHPQGGPSVTLSDARRATWEAPQAHYQQQAVAFVCSPDKRDADHLMSRLATGGRNPARLAIAAWDAELEARMRGAMEASP